MKLNRFIMAVNAVFCLSALLSGRSDDDVYKVYVPKIRTLQTKSSDSDEKLRKVFHVAVTAGDHVTCLGRKMGGGVKAQLTMDKAKVQEHNSSCGTDYPSLPSDCCTPMTETVIPAGESSSADLVLTINAQGRIQSFNSYLLPVTITPMEGTQADHIQRTVYCLLSSAENVRAMPLANRSAWQVVEVSSEEMSGEGLDNGHAIHIFGGLKGIFWCTQWKGNEPQPPHHTVVDMRQEVEVLGLQYVSRDHGEAQPQEMVVRTSLDSSKWESAGTHNDPPAEVKEEFRLYFPELRQIRHFRLTVITMYSGKWATVVVEVNVILTIK